MSAEPSGLRLRGAVGSAVAVGAVAWAVGVSWPQSVLLGALVAALLPLLANPVDATVTLPRLPPRHRHGARVEVSRLAWALSGRRGQADHAVVRRLKALATRRLGDLHIDLADPAHLAAAENALGSWAYSVVVEGTELGRGDVLRLVDVVERLGHMRSVPGPDSARFVDTGQ